VARRERVARAHLPGRAGRHRLAPEPEQHEPPPTTLRAAVWEPFVGLLARHRALEMLAFVLTYKSPTSSRRPHAAVLIDMGYQRRRPRLRLATVGLAATLLGTFLGGFGTRLLGLGTRLWLFGFLQTFATLGYCCSRGAP